jgi:hypothetical protein
MKTTLTITLELPDDLVENTVKNILENYPEAGQGLAIQCTRWNYDKWDFVIVTPNLARLTGLRRKIS